MERFRKPKIKAVYLWIALGVLVLGFALVLITAEVNEREYMDLQLEAARRMEQAEAYLKERILSLGLEIDEMDLNKTALIGPEFTELTTTPGDESAKRTALNPNFAAAMVRWFTEAGLEKGDKIAIGTSGSFPGFAIASTIAATVMELDVKMIASCGASMHGATRTEYTIFDILLDMKDAGYVDFDMLAVSGGGANDQGISAFEGFLYEGTEALFDDICQRAAARSGAEWINYDNLNDSIMRRFELYGDNVKLFVNIGGASPNCGTSSYTLNFPQGLVMPENFPEIPKVIDRGLNYEYAEIGVPVLNLLNVKLLAQENDIAYDSVPMQKAGESGVYAQTKYSRALIIITLLLTLFVLNFGYLRCNVFKGSKECQPSSEE